MITPGIFARTFQRDSLDDLLAVISATGIAQVHFNLRCVGLDPLPADIPAELPAQVKNAFHRHNLHMCGLSGTYNTIDPDPSRRREQTRRAVRLIETAPSFGADLVSLCTGTRDATNMWRGHPDNDTADAWRDLLHTLEQLLTAAERSGVTLGIEPEPANVIHSAPFARRLLDEFHTPHLKIILDGANLFAPGDTTAMPEHITEAFAVLSPDIVLVHAKDIPGPGCTSQAAGTGLLDWDTYFDRIAAAGYHGPVVLHGLVEQEVPTSLAFIQRQIERIAAKAP